MTDKPLTGYPSIDKPWLKYYSEEAMNVPLLTGTVYENLQKSNQDHPDETALIYFKRKITFAQMFDMIEKVKSAFLRNGVKKGDKVILFTSSTPETVYAILALCRIGAAANIINPLFTPDQIEARINETDAEIMIVLDQLYDRISDVLPRLCIKKIVVIPIYLSMPVTTGSLARIKMKKKIAYGEKITSWQDFLKGDILSEPDAPHETGRPFIIVYSSGSTGASKGIVLTNEGINVKLMNYLRPEYFPNNRGDIFLQMIPIWFSTGIVLSIFEPLFTGCSVILEPVFSKESFAKDIHDYHPNSTLAATSLYVYAMTCEELKNADLSGMTLPVTGGELMLARVEILLNQWLKDHGSKASMLKGYGMCELGGTVTFDNALANKTGDVGIPIKGVTVAAFDMKTDKELQYNQRGEIRVNSLARMKEYFKNPQATQEFFREDENGTVWGCTGDMGYVDEDGFVFILGRCSDHFISSKGNKVYCFDIENIILKNQDISQCEVVAIQDGSGKNYPVAQIILEDSCRIPAYQLISQIHSQCIKELREDEIPQGYKIVKSFPVKNNGKRDMDMIAADRNDYMVPASGKLVSVDFSGKVTHE